MILAAADAAEGLGPPPEELQLAWQVHRWHTLPNEGGLRDQPAGVVLRMGIAESVYNAVKAWKAATDWTKWSAQNPDQWGVVQSVIDLRKASENGS